MLMSSAALTPGYLEMWSKLVQGSKFRAGQRIRGLRATAMSTPRPISGNHLAALERHDASARPMAMMPQWAIIVARFRAHFQKAIFFLIPAMGELEYWKFLYAVQNPMYVAVAPLESKIVVMSTYVPEGVGDEMSHERCRFHCSYACLKIAAATPIVAKHQIFVLPECLHIGGMEIATDSCPVTFGEYTAPLPEQDALGSSVRRLPPRIPTMSNY